MAASLPYVIWSELMANSKTGGHFNDVNLLLTKTVGKMLLYSLQLAYQLSEHHQDENALLL